MPDRFRDIGSFWGVVLLWLGVFSPPLIGAILYDARYGQSLTLRERGVNWFIATGIGVLGGGVCSEIWTLGSFTTSAISVGFAWIGNDLVTIVRAILTPFKNDPLGSFKEWWGAFWRRGQQ